VPLARPRERASAGFARIEDRVLRQVLRRDAGSDALSGNAHAGSYADSLFTTDGSIARL
jgi:sulfonate transport system ATP-binding protein